jgi:transcriptional regulator with XRE-family HTH domain
MTRGVVAARVRDEMALAKKEFARRLRAARENADLTQTQVAQQIGVDWATYQRWEVGRTSPRPGKIEAIAGALGVEVEHLQGAEEDTDTTLERLVKQVDTNSRALRELRVGIDGLIETLAELAGRVERIEEAVAPITRREDWDQAAREDQATRESHARIERGLAERRADREARPRSS